MTDRNKENMSLGENNGTQNGNKYYIAKMMAKNPTCVSYVYVHTPSYIFYMH